MSFSFQTAVREQLKARVAIDGPSGSGKTWTSLTCATALAGPNGRIAVIDTERGSARLYADFFKFDVLELPMDHRMFNPEVYVEALHAAEEAGYNVIVIDSLSHAWEGEGGALSLVDQAVAASRSGNSYVAWRKVTPLHNKLVDAMLQSPAHIVCTMRSKMEYEQREEGGKKQVVKVGMAPIQRAGMEYEFTMVADIDVDHRLIVSKSRMKELADRQMVKPDVKFFKELADWLNGGAPATERPSQKAPIGMSMAAAETKSYDMSFADLLTAAQKKYNVTEEQVRAALRAAKFTTYTPDMATAAMTAIGMAFQKPVEEEVPDFAK